MNFNNKARLRRVLWDIEETEKRFRAFDFEGALCKLMSTREKLNELVEKIRLNEVSETEEK